LNAVQESYESLPYPHCVHPLSHPARLAAIGALLGFAAIPPSQARILDIGCGSASSLLAMAARLPQSQLMGIDFSTPDIFSAQALAREAGLTNVSFQQADLLTWNPAGAKFDYIIAYGVFSWVADEVKDRLLALISECLAPQGIACVSYATYPGCKQSEALRDLLKLRTDSLVSRAEKVATAHQTLDFLDRAWQRLPKFSHATHLREEVGRIRRKQPHFLLLDDLGVERDPCYLLQFTNWAAEHGLRYLAESELHTMLLENLPPQSAQELADMGLDHLETEQMIDYITNRTFRCSLLVKTEVSWQAKLDAQPLRQLCLRSLLQPAERINSGAQKGAFESEQGAKFTLQGVALVEFVQALSSQPTACLPFRDVFSKVQKTLGKTLDETEEKQLAENLLDLVAKRQIEIGALAFTPPSTIPEYPSLTPLNLAMCRHRGNLVDAHNRAIQLAEEEIAFCLELDGSKSFSGLSLDQDRQKTGYHPLLATLSRLGCLAV